MRVDLVGGVVVLERALEVFGVLVAATDLDLGDNELLGFEVDFLFFLKKTLGELSFLLLF